MIFKQLFEFYVLMFEMKVECNNKRIIGHSNEISTKFKMVKPNSNVIQMEDSIVSVQDILNNEVPEIPLETTYNVSWLVINGKQIANIPKCVSERKEWYLVHGEDEVQEESNELDISLRNSSIECELYLNNIKTRMFSTNSTAKAEMYHQIHVDEGLKQILPYLVHWIQSEVEVVICVHNRFNRFWGQNQNVCYPI